MAKIEELARAVEFGRAKLVPGLVQESIEEGNPLWEMENVFLTPHIAGSQGDECHRMAEYMREEFLAFTI